MLKKPWIIVESELDAFMLYEKIGDLLKIFAIGNSTARPDTNTHEYIKDTPGLLCLDNDEAGQAEQDWWHNQYPQSLTWYSKKAKDPGEDFQAGVDIAAWIKKGIDKLCITSTDVARIKNNTSSFKQQILKQNKEKIVQKQSDQIQKQSKIIQKPKKQAICMHNIYCPSLKQNTCLIDKSRPNQTLICPKKYWYAVKTTEAITEIILAPGIRR